jgi:hypothetical protein
MVLAIPILNDIPDDSLGIKMNLELKGGEEIVLQYVPLDDETYLTAGSWELDEAVRAIADLICREMSEVDREFQLWQS